MALWSRFFWSNRPNYPFILLEIVHWEGNQCRILCRKWNIWTSWIVLNVGALCTPQVMRIADRGCDIVRITVQGKKEADACYDIKNTLVQKGWSFSYFNPFPAIVHCYRFLIMLTKGFYNCMQCVCSSNGWNIVNVSTPCSSGRAGDRSQH